MSALLPPTTIFIAKQELKKQFQTKKFFMQQQSIEKKVTSVARVAIGSRVSVSLQSGEIRKFKIVDNAEGGVPQEGTISKNSPLGRALIDRATGEKVIYMVGEKLLTAEVTGVEAV